MTATAGERRREGRDLLAYVCPERLAAAHVHRRETRRKMVSSFKAKEATAEQTLALALLCRLR